MNEKLKNIKNLRRIPEKGIIAGVAAGIAYFFGWPLWIVRLVLAVLILGGFSFAPLLYLLAWIFVPKMERVPEDFDSITK
jgi:phage shock protein PspC (stress-responsive transcriptional regulator)